MMTPSELGGRANDIAKDLEKIDKTDAMHECCDVLRQQVTREFALEQDPFGAPWKQWYWSASYPVSPHKTLQASGMLMASFVTQQAGHIERVDGNSLAFGSEVKYAGIHQDGATFRLGIWLFGRAGGVKRPGDMITIPARPIVGWPEDTIAACGDIVAMAVMAEWHKEMPYEQPSEFADANRL